MSVYDSDAIPPDEAIRRISDVLGVDSHRLRSVVRESHKVNPRVHRQYLFKLRCRTVMALAAKWRTDHDRPFANKRVIRAMITCPDAGFFFIHIPKNGGSSVRDQIQNLDAFSGQFFGMKTHPELARYDSSHVPLAALRDYFLEAFATIAALDGYCIVRDPTERFISSLAQQFRQIRRRRPDQVTAEEVRAEMDTVMAHLSDTTGMLHHTFSHFIRQSEFIELDGEKMVANIYRMDDIGGLLNALSIRLGKPLVEDFHSNKTVTFRLNWLASPTIVAKDFLKSRAPAPIVDRLRSIAMKVLTRPRVKTIDDEVLNSAEVRNFIQSYYARDFEIVAALLPGEERPELVR